MTTYTIATDDGLVMWREDIFATREEADAFLAENPLTPSGSRQVVVSTEQAHALTEMRHETRVESDRVLARVRAARVSAIIGEESAPARCAVCGGPFTDGSGCEFCPAVIDTTPAPFKYYACSCCGHVETRQSDVEAPAKCEHCGAHHTALHSFGDLDAGEAWSDGVCGDLLDDAIERQTGRHPAR